MSPDPMILLAWLSKSLIPESSFEENTNPTATQYGIAPGDYVTVMLTGDENGNSGRMHSELIAATVLDPEEHAEFFPDHAVRSNKSFVLLRWRSDEDLTDDGHLGWFPRVLLVKMNEEQHATITNWIEGDIPKQMEETRWLSDLFNDQLEEMSADNQNGVPAPLRCGRCDGREVQLHSLVENRDSFRVGVIEADSDKPTLVPLSEAAHDGQRFFHLHCKSCGSEMSEEEVVKRYNIDLSKLHNHHH